MNIQWLKLDVNILTNEKIDLIRSYPDGDSIVIMWFGLLCMGMKSSECGVIKLADGLPYTIDDLSRVLKIPFKTAQLGIELFMKYGMIKSTEGGMMEIVNFRKHQSIDQIELKREHNRIKVAKFRAKKDALLLNDVTVTEVTCNQQRREDKNREEKNRIDDKIEIAFEEFWFLYDKKTGKDKAYKKFIKLSNKDHIDILKAIPNYVIATPDKTYRKDPLTYLNGRHWEDEIIIKDIKPKSNPIEQELKDRADKYVEERRTIAKGQGWSFGADNEKETYWNYINKHKGK